MRLRLRVRISLALAAVTVAAALQIGVQARQATSPLDDAQRLFYNGRYEEAAALALEVRSADPQDLATYELRTSALLFQLKRFLEQPGDKRLDREEVLRRCTGCTEPMAAFLSDFREGRSLAHAAVRANPKDERALFFLGKLDLNYIWLQLGPLSRKTGWDEYWEARKSLDAVLKQNPRHVRARVARAWIDYIVDTKMPWGTAWLLGGGSKKRALTALREAAASDADFFTRVEAEFALWEMQVRERNFDEATAVAHRLARAFPENRDLASFIQTREAGAR
jgi:tetratricopeptide (TPR) repeat protein